jgi:hypothetical protein
MGTAGLLGPQNALPGPGSGSGPAALIDRKGTPSGRCLRQPEASFR